MDSQLQKTETTQEEAIVSKKVQAWGSFGSQLHHTELQLQARAQKAILRLKYPKDINEVAECEKILAEVKSEALRIDEDRKPFTQRIQDVSSRLMQPKKIIDENTLLVSNKIIAVKSAYQKEQADKQKKIDEEKNIREWLINMMAKVDETFKTNIQTTINKAYEHALGEGNITMETLESFLRQTAARFSHKNFMAELPPRTLVLVTKEEYDLMANELFSWSTQTYLDMYHNDLNAKFVDYAIAVNNKAQALELSKKEEKEKAEQIAAQTQNTMVSAKLEAVANVPLNTVTEVKALKESYEIDMPETIESVLLIMAAFSANIHLCLPKLKVNKWFAFTPSQAANALSKVKCDDNAFAPAGLTFRKIEKL